MNNKSCYSQGLISYKLGLTIGDNPYTTELVGGVPKAHMWKQGFVDCRDKFKRHDIYEVGINASGIRNKNETNRKTTSRSN